ncbi:MAG: SGNH/GDSL hydrolase family protein [Flavobacteriales bacterium]|nr:SGNH/GDSL hydrolase family protein [Flavobacteriales bacterium]
MAAILLFAGWLLAGCSDDNGMVPPGGNQVNHSDTTAADTAIAFSYLALGDSYTIGTGLSDESNSYPVQLVERLNQNIVLAGSAPRIIARNGWTTGNLLFATDTAAIDTTYQLVSLLIGVNNQFQNRPIEEYTEHFQELLDKSIAYAAGDTAKVFVLSIPDYGVTPFGNDYPNASEGVDNFNAVNQEITENYGIAYFNITEISRLAEDNPKLLASDELHPSGVMYSLWVDFILADIEEKLLE